MVPEWASDHPPGRSGFLLQKLKNLRITRTVDRLDMINECKGLVFFVYPPRRCTLVSCGLDFMLPLQHDREWPWKSSIARSSWIPWQGRDLPTFCLVREMYIVFTPPITKRLSLWQPGTSGRPVVPLSLILRRLDQPNQRALIFCSEEAHFGITRTDLRLDGHPAVCQQR